ncbi:MAG: hypothetical protein H7210_14925 [Pyrinomonadaceae bacterium]|nr:hypothetical protein [Phycisphaerales bacterium]
MPSLPPTNRLHLMVLPLITALALGSCVTTSPIPQRRGIPIGPTSSVSKSNPNTPSSAGSTTHAPAMPDGPISTPVSKGSTFASHVTVSLMEIGSVPFDGQVLPLISPDGRFIAVESGEPPPWATLLATNDQRPAQGTRILAYSIDESIKSDKPPGQAPILPPLPWSLTPQAPPADAALSPTGLPIGAVLGRSCDNAGFLIELPRADGTRWIGRVEWISGKLSWLVRDGLVNAHAAIGPGGDLAYSRRVVGSPLWELVIRKPGVGGAEVVMHTPEVSYCYPLFSDELEVVYAFVLSASGVELFAYRIPVTGGERELTVLGRRQILSTPDEAAVFQSVAALQVPPVNPGQPLVQPVKGGEGSGAEEMGTLLMFHPGAGRMCVFDRRSGGLSPLLEKSFAAATVLSQGTAGYLLSTEKSLRYMAAGAEKSPNSATYKAQATEGVNVVAGSLLPRLTTNLQWPYVLIGPGGKAGESRFRVMKLRLEEVR